MRLKSILNLMFIATILWSCANDKKTAPTEAIVETPTEAIVEKETVEFNYNVEQFADIKVLRYQIPGWGKLSLKECICFLNIYLFGRIVTLKHISVKIRIKYK